MQSGRANGKIGEMTRSERLFGGWFEGDAKAQRGELADVVANRARGVDLAEITIPDYPVATDRLSQPTAGSERADNVTGLRPIAGESTVGLLIVRH